VNWKKENCREQKRVSHLCRFHFCGTGVQPLSAGLECAAPLALGVGEQGQLRYKTLRLRCFGAAPQDDTFILLSGGS